MGADIQKRIFALNLNTYVVQSGKTQNEIANDLGVSPQRLNTWTQGIAIPRIDAIQMLADYFGINKSDLLEEKRKLILMDDVKNIIKNRRVEMNLTMKDLADLVGVSEGTISRWESGDIANMRRDKIAALANALHLSPAAIMGLDGSIPEYFYDPETAEFAQEFYENEDMRILFKAARKSRHEDIQLVVDMLNRLKRTNPDG